ncbi:MAG: AzlC family ABC transporter permease [Clostridia bacterium]|nr:AzlC family ABC transporter permease [Clostridia bacterium]
MKQNQFLKGVKDGFPICLGYLSVAFAFGIFAVSSSLSVKEALLISMTNVTSAGQLAAVPCIVGGGSLIELAVSQLVINSRYALMSVSLSQKLDDKVTLPHRFIIAFVNTDEVFAVATSQKENVSKKYMYGLILTPYVGWSLGTLIGAVAGDVLPASIISALSIAIYGMFIAIVVPEIKENKSTAICAAIACVLSILFYFVPFLKAVPQGFVIIICACVAAVVAALLFPIKIKEVQADEI